MAGLVTAAQLVVATDDELKTANRMIVAVLDSRQATETRLKVAQFHVGQDVKFNDKLGRPTVITIERINAKSVVGVCKLTKKKWRVHPSFLTAP